MSDTAPEVKPEELPGLVIDVMSAHERKALSNIQRNRYMQGCTCGWIGYPHTDHRQLELYTMLLRLQIAIPAQPDTEPEDNE